MARPIRIEFPGAIYHVTSRGNAKQTVFLTDLDRLAFLEIFSDVISKYNWLCHGYCLMDNHYHLLVETIDPTLSPGMRQLNGVYSQKFNRYHDRVGHVFQGRYKSILVEKNEYLLELCRYIVLNPVRAKIVKDPGQWKWSSYEATAGIKKEHEFLHVEWLQSQFGKSKQQACKRYRQFVADGMQNSGEKLWDNLVGQIVLGGKEFAADIQGRIIDSQRISEIPRTQRFPGRPSLPEIFSDKQSLSKEFRNDQIVYAHVECGYTLKEISEQLQIHYTTVSKVIKKRKK
jgi:REP element-mobilizing transposase RayT